MFNFKGKVNAGIDCVEFNEIGLKEIINDVVFSFDFYNKFKNECFFSESDDFIIAFNGFLFDKSDNVKQSDFILKLFRNNDFKKAINKLNGIFNFFYIDKKTKKIYLAVDHLATKKVFYSFGREGGFFSTQLKDFKSSTDLNLKNIYFYLAMGFYESGKTYLNNVYQLEPGEYLEYGLLDGGVNIYRHTTFTSVKKEREYPELLSMYNDILVSSIESIDKINDSYGFPSSTSLSGGLDAKAVACILKKCSASRLKTFTFSEYGAADQYIAQDVANHIGSEHLYMSLNNGSHLYTRVEDYVNNTHGLISFHGSLHTFNMYNSINSSGLGLHLSGQIGDVIFGSSIKNNFDIYSDYEKLSYCGRIPEFLKNLVSKNNDFFNKYSNFDYELLNLHLRQSSGTIFGDVCIGSILQTTSPFYNKRLIDLTMSVPSSIKKHEKLYIDLLLKYHPEVASFKWDKSNSKPSSYLKTRFFKYINTIYNGVKRRLKLPYNNMNPFDVWIESNEEIISSLDLIFSENIKLTDFNVELKSVLSRVYKDETDKYSRRKFAVATFLLMLKNRNDNV